MAGRAVWFACHNAAPGYSTLRYATFKLIGFSVGPSVRRGEPLRTRQPVDRPRRRLAASYGADLKAVAPASCWFSLVRFLCSANRSESFVVVNGCKVKQCVPRTCTRVVRKHRTCTRTRASACLVPLTLLGRDCHRQFFRDGVERRTRARPPRLLRDSDFRRPARTAAHSSPKSTTQRFCRVGRRTYVPRTCWLRLQAGKGGRTKPPTTTGGFHIACLRLLQSPWPAELRAEPPPADYF